MLTDKLKFFPHSSQREVEPSVRLAQFWGVLGGGVGGVHSSKQSPKFSISGHSVPLLYFSTL